MRCAAAHRLEGSRFGIHLAALANFASKLVRPEGAKTGGSRERPNGLQLYGRVVNESEPRVNHHAGLFAGAACCEILWSD
jgi:hypothetical protein